MWHHFKHFQSKDVFFSCCISFTALELFCHNYMKKSLITSGSQNINTPFIILSARPTSTPGPKRDQLVSHVQISQTMALHAARSQKGSTSFSCSDLPNHGSSCRALGIFWKALDELYGCSTHLVWDSLELQCGSYGFFNHFCQWKT
jgi:hypothetical protein